MFNRVSSCRLASAPEQGSHACHFDRPRVAPTWERIYQFSNFDRAPCVFSKPKNLGLSVIPQLRLLPCSDTCGPGAMQPNAPHDLQGRIPGPCPLAQPNTEYANTSSPYFIQKSVENQGTGF
jgi:hypothetical protein